METTAAARGVSLSIPSPPPRKEWRAVSENSSRSAGSEGRELADVDFCSITIDGSLDNDNLQQELQNVAHQRKELQHMEIELRARIVARSGLLEMQKTFDNQFKEHANAYAKLQEQLHLKDQAIHDLEKKIDLKDRELHAIKLDNEAAWAKEDLLREQNKELQTYRIEHDNSEAERSQLLKQIHDLQEHIQDRERQLLELQEQHRVAQEAIMYKDEQLREAQAWIARVQEMDAMQSSANHNLQAELRERTEQYNQLWLACQRQFADMERLHLHTVQQLQLELADARGRIGSSADESHVTQGNSNDSSQFARNGNQLEANVTQANSNDSSQFARNGNQLESNGSITSTGNSGALLNGNTENHFSYVSTGNASTQADNVLGIAIAPSTLLGMPSHLVPTQVATMQPFIMHPQGVPNSVPALVSRSQVDQFQSWQNQQALPDGSQLLPSIQYPPSQNFDYEAPVDGQAVRQDSLEVHFSQGLESKSVNPPPAEVGKVGTTLASSSQDSLQQISSQFHDALRLGDVAQKSGVEEKTITNLANHVLESQGSTSERPHSPADSSSVTAVPRGSSDVTTAKNGFGVASSESFASSGQKNMSDSVKSSEAALLDERSLLACIVRTIPPGSGGKIRISSTLPNRLGKMLAPLHWHDYKRNYGKLDDFVAGHPELFLIDGDYIQLREGAQEIIAATAAAAKVAAAAKTAASPFSSISPSVTVTPMAESYRIKRDPSIDSNYSHDSVRSHLSNGTTNVKILIKPKDMKDLNGIESRHGHSVGVTTVNSDRSVRGSSGSNSMAKQQERRAGVALNSRR